MDNILLEQREGDVVTLTINRPEKLNAMTKPLWQALGQTVERLSKDLSLRCLVLRGAGDRSFSPGNDI
ncbi:MAG: enoyl-CoA hydratase/isomerase family protein, partial [Burkholderiaceae bacterium]